MINLAVMAVVLILVYLLSYYGWVRSRPTPDSFLLDYKSVPIGPVSRGLETIHKPLIWLDAKRYVRVYQLAEPPILDDSDLEPPDFKLASSRPAQTK